MYDRKHLNNLIVLFLAIGLAACGRGSLNPTAAVPIPSTAAIGSPTGVISNPTPSSAPTATPMPPARLLTVCLGSEPASLFYYDAGSAAAQAVLAAVYDGPVDIQDYTPQPVILNKIPSLADGDALLQPVEVKPGDMIADSSGDPVPLKEGVEYRPSGCSEAACTQVYSGDQPVQMDQLVLRFTLLAGIQWSDGTPLTASDSVYSYEVARSLTPATQSDLINRTGSYQALDGATVEWAGIPGYQDSPYHAKFFTPLPRHAWSALPAADLRSADLAARMPLGWGPYVIDEWVAGDHISLHKNTLYFRAAENLPHFDSLVYRFVARGEEALDALLAGECDLLDRTAVLESQSARLTELQAAGQIQFAFLQDASWEQLTFGITSLDSQRAQFFASKEVRQAVAQCIDREALVASQPSGVQLLMDSYVPQSHPLYNPQVRQYGFDPTGASALLEAAGWLDPDSDPATPRIAQGVQGVPDGTPFEVQYLVSPASRQQADAKAIQASLQKCGIRASIVTRDVQEYLAPGPGGPVFGRAFDLAQFAWVAALEPPCYLYLSSEIPGPYPDYPKSWGGVNAGGYSNPDYDHACTNGLLSAPDSPLHRSEHLRSQEIFSEELPVLPLYAHFNLVVSRPDLCPIESVSAVDSTWSNLEVIDYGGGCPH